MTLFDLFFGECYCGDGIDCEFLALLGWKEGVEVSFGFCGIGLKEEVETRWGWDAQGYVFEMDSLLIPGRVRFSRHSEVQRSSRPFLWPRRARGASPIAM